MQPGWVALGAGLAATLPRIGGMPVAVSNERVRFGVFFYIAAVLGMGATMSATGLSEALGAVVQGALDLKPQQDGLNFLVLSLLATFTAVLVTNPGQPALLAPLAGQFAEAAGWPLKAALMTMAVGFTTLLLPYQVPPVVVGLQVAGIKLRTALRLTVPLAAVSFVTLLPLDYLWWRLIGYFG
ncbi:MAG: anion permease [Betaproteobacteria bacterium]|nr:anion permease [Betaproteobacteria bacterium]